MASNETCPQCGRPLSDVLEEQWAPDPESSDLYYCSEGCMMGATTPTGNTSGIDPSLDAPEDPTA